MTRNRWKAAAVVLLAALLGAALGSALTAGRLSHRFGWSGGHHHWTEGYVRLLDKDLKLTAPQRDSIAAILRRHTSDMDSTWALIRPRMDAMRDSIRADIRRQLTVEQQGRYAELVRRIDADRGERHRGEDRDTE
jgi:Spy/CpxP family protein refolding chaperone